MSTRTVSVLALGAALAFSASACSDAGDGTAAGGPAATAAPTAAAPAPTTTAAAPAPTATGAAPTTTAPAGGSTTTTGPAAPATGRACPVTAATLLAAMRADKSGGSQLARGATLGRPVCHAGYVLVKKTSPKDANGKPVADDETARFVYESGSWEYRGASTADFCIGMPGAIRNYFRSHYAGGCGG
ncbi:hypothetical protein ACFQFC_10335 [Amorphoplanes digitatis]|uniref:Lipoprotein n=1 Tax=Actinoplanes digitatis TaxID=1868 RepID=A0A7W7I1M2_9ACTN|nr:hypothetical protein [Actinoplanes digitatis]MBB4764596.1 hypothetical protein [Actinoplanes digitatis]GID91453.1 hypothetical protein Adi01nite_08650 [Actinoplanes digitatis]